MAEPTNEFKSLWAETLDKIKKCEISGQYNDESASNIFNEFKYKLLNWSETNYPRSFEMREAILKFYLALLYHEDSTIAYFINLNRQYE